uniref:HMG box domain-containing protein n=1 Tax=Pyramimonas orientalis virus TaxID=455367 RepID=A0A7M3UNQ9_POV01|nr:hypothetical protein HWQ62_00199 [Pyramimonas orientalis virus]
MNTSSYQKFTKSFHKFTEDYNKELLEKITTTLTLCEEDKTKLVELFGTLSSKCDMHCAKPNKKKREPTEYNLFMKDMIKELRQTHPEIDKKELMSMGAKEWQKKKALKAKEAEAQAAQPEEKKVKKEKKKP